LQGVQQNLVDTVTILATAYIHCSADTSGEIYVVGAALSGSEEMGVVHQKLLAGYIQLFASALAPHSSLPPEELHWRCIGLIGAGGALSLLMGGGNAASRKRRLPFPP